MSSNWFPGLWSGSLNAAWKLCPLAVLPTEQINAIDITANICWLRHSTHGQQTPHQARQKGLTISIRSIVQLCDNKKTTFLMLNGTVKINCGCKLDASEPHKITHNKCPIHSWACEKNYYDGHNNKRFYWIIKLSNLYLREESHES